MREVSKINSTQMIQDELDTDCGDGAPVTQLAQGTERSIYVRSNMTKCVDYVPVKKDHVLHQVQQWYVLEDEGYTGNT